MKGRGFPLSNYGKNKKHPVEKVLAAYVTTPYIVNDIGNFAFGPAKAFMYGFGRNRKQKFGMSFTIVYHIQGDYSSKNLRNLTFRPSVVKVTAPVSYVTEMLVLDALRRSNNS